MIRSGTKELSWVGSSLDDLRAFPGRARRIAGCQLYRVQRGRRPDDQKPLPTIGAGVYEIRIRTELEHRVFYIAKFADKVYVLHAFEKKTGKTVRRDTELGRVRYREVMKRRQLLACHQEGQAQA
jgi:phage-related protein